MAYSAALRICQKVIQKLAMVRDLIKLSDPANQNSREATFSRFLSKHIREVRPNRITPRHPREEYLISSNASSYEYEWHYMAFCTLWRSSAVNSTDESTDETNVLVCFDLDDNITLRLRRLLQKADLRHWKNEPFLMLEYALKAVVGQCEDDIWSFQKPMRIVEKVLPLSSILYAVYI